MKKFSPIYFFLTITILNVVLFLYMAHMLGGRVVWKSFIWWDIFIFIIGAISLLVKLGLERVVGFDRRKTTAGKILSKVFGWLLWFLIIIPFFLAALTVHRPKIADKLNPQIAFGLPFESVILNTKDKVCLKAWFVSNAESQKSVVIAHGLGANKSNFIDLVQLWHNLGFNVIIFDFRGHGDSDGNTTYLGYRERLDVESAVDYLSKRPGINSKEIYGYGVSFGAAALIHAAAEDPRIKCLVVDSALSNIDQTSDRFLERILGGLIGVKPLVKHLGFFWINVQLGYDVRAHSPQETVRQLKNQPILIIHGQGDPLIDWHQSQILFDNAPMPKVLHLFKVEQHYATLADPQYISAIADFLRQQGN